MSTTIRILEQLAENRVPSGVTDLANTLGTTKARIYRHLRTLVSLGYVHQDAETEKYRLGVRLFLLSHAIGEQFDFVAVARDIGRSLCEKFGQTVVISGLDGDAMRVLEVFRSFSPVEVVTNRGTSLDLHATAQGRIALAFGPPELLERTLREPLRAWTQHTKTNPALIRREVEKVRHQGWASAAEETLEGVNAVAAPVRNSDGSLAGTIAILGSVQFVPPSPPESQIRAILAAAREISHILGYAEPPVGKRRA